MLRQHMARLLRSGSRPRILRKGETYAWQYYFGRTICEQADCAYMDRVLDILAFRRFAWSVIRGVERLCAYRGEIVF
jgi:hypothetical protein